MGAVLPAGIHSGLRPVPMLVPPLLVTHTHATRAFSRRPSSLRLLPRCPPLARRVTSRGASLIADQIRCCCQPNEADRLTACRRLRGIAAGSRRVAFRGAASAHSANGDRANLCATSLPTSSKTTLVLPV